jgi:hypothetical protein
MTNPYQSSIGSRTALKEAWTSDRWYVMLAWCFLYAYPAVGIGLLYGTWMIARWTLGYAPQPSLNDPRQISSLVSGLYVLAECFLMLWPVMVVLALAAIYYYPMSFWKRSLVWRLFLFLGFVGQCVIIAMIVRIDPGRVLEWWAD